MKISITFTAIFVIALQGVVSKDQQVRKQDLQETLSNIKDMKSILQAQMNKVAVMTSIEMMGSEKALSSAGVNNDVSIEQLVQQLIAFQQKDGQEISVFDAETRELFTKTEKKLDESRNEDYHEFSQERNQKISEIEAQIRPIDEKISQIKQLSAEEQINQMGQSQLFVLTSENANLVSQIQNVGDFIKSPMTIALETEIQSILAQRAASRAEKIAISEKKHADIVTQIQAIDEFTIKTMNSIIKQNQMVLSLQLRAVQDFIDLFNSFDRFSSKFHVKSDFAFMGGDLALNVYNELNATINTLKQEINDRQLILKDLITNLGVTIELQKERQV